MPDLSDDPYTKEVDDWEQSEPKDYRWRVIDPDAAVLDTFLEVVSGQPRSPMAIRDLHGKKLPFKNNRRSRARYLYYLFVVAQLRLAWRHNYRKDPSEVLAKQLGKRFWATKGRYMKNSSLLASTLRPLFNAFLVMRLVTPTTPTIRDSWQSPNFYSIPERQTARMTTVTMTTMRRDMYSVTGRYI